jgi:hypothetical protein
MGGEGKAWERIEGRRGETEGGEEVIDTEGGKARKEG